VDVWENFAAEVLSFRLNGTVGVYRVPQTVASNNRGLNNEAMVQTAFYHNAISPLFLLPTPQGKAVQFSIPGGTEGTHDMTVSLDQTLVGEVKFPSQDWNVILDIAGTYNRIDQPRIVRRAVHQLYGYMVEQNARYGFLTTYNDTWFFRRSFENPRILQVSPLVPGSPGVGAPTVLRCIWYLINQNYEFVRRQQGDDDSYFSQDEPPPKDPSSSDPSSSGTEFTPSPASRKRLQSELSPLGPGLRSHNKKGKTDGKKNLDSLVGIEPRENSFSFTNNNGIRFESAVRVIKQDPDMEQRQLCLLLSALDSEDEYKLERIENALDSLQDLQGEHVPRLLCPLGLWKDKPALVLESFRPIELAALSSKEKVQVLDALRAFHRRSVLLGERKNLSIGQSDVDGAILLFGLDNVMEADPDSAKDEMRKEARALRDLLYPLEIPLSKKKSTVDLVEHKKAEDEVREKSLQTDVEAKNTVAMNVDTEDEGKENVGQYVL
jgi:hypothetical protein